jgi:hypothetical protein
MGYVSIAKLSTRESTGNSGSATLETREKAGGEPALGPVGDSLDDLER